MITKNVHDIHIQKTLIFLEQSIKSLYRGNDHCNAETKIFSKNHILHITHC